MTRKLADLTGNEDEDELDLPDGTPSVIPMPACNPPATVPALPQGGFMSGIIVSGIYGDMEPPGPDPEKVGEDAIRQYDGLTKEEIGGLVIRLSQQLDTLSEQTMSRDGWNQFDKLVEIFEELTGHGEDEEREDEEDDAQCTNIMGNRWKEQTPLNK